MSDTQGTQWYDLDELTLWEDNPNQGDIGSIITSINKHGYNDVVAVYNGVVKGGNHRVPALKQLRDGGYIPTHKDTQLRVNNGGTWQITGMDVSHFETEQEANAFALALNRTTRLGQDDPVMLAALLQNIAAQDVALMESTGFDGDDLDALLEELNPFEPPTDAGAQVDRASELQEKWQVARGDVWIIPSGSGDGCHRVMCGDSTNADDVALLMGGEKAQLLITDPPYGVNFVGGKYIPGRKAKAEQWGHIQNDDKQGQELQQWLKALWEVWLKHVKRDFAFYSWAAAKSEYVMAIAAAAAGIHIQSQIIWAKNFLVLGQADYQWMHENCIYGFLKGESHRWLGGRKQTTVWSVDRVPTNNYEHPTQKPVGLFIIPIENHTYKKEVVSDPFLGSGTTIVACEQTRRIGYGMEISEACVAVSLQRLQDLGLQPERQ